MRRPAPITPIRMVSFAPNTLADARAVSPLPRTKLRRLIMGRTSSQLRCYKPSPGVLALRLGRDLGVSRRSLRQILIDRCLDIAHTPANAACEQIQEEFVRPILGTVPDRGKEHAPLPFHPG